MGRQGRHILRLPLALLAATAILLAAEARPFSVIRHDVNMVSTRLCARTKYPDYCNDVMIGPDSDASVQVVINVGVKPSINDLAGPFGAYAAALAKKLAADPQAVAALKTCEQGFPVAAGALRKADAANAANNYAELQTNVKAALNAVLECVNGIEHIPALRSDDLFGKVFAVQKSLSITNTVANLLK